MYTVEVKTNFELTTEKKRLFDISTAAYLSGEFTDSANSAIWTKIFKAYEDMEECHPSIEDAIIDCLTTARAILGFLTDDDYELYEDLKSSLEDKLVDSENAFKTAVNELAKECGYKDEIFLDMYRTEEDFLKAKKIFERLKAEKYIDEDCEF